jgi:phosphopantetheinyl transferase (holo-ACP synthase)
MRDANGPPQITLHKKAKELCRRHGIKSSFLSLTDEGMYAVAVVVLEG